MADWKEVRIAVVSDIHGNRTAFDAVLADLRQTSPDLIFNGGDLTHGGASPVEIVDRVRDLGWPGVMGNTDEILPKPEAFKEFASHSPQHQGLWTVIEQMADAVRERLGQERIDWLASLPHVQMHGPMALVHASPDSTWRSPSQDASDDELHEMYSPLGRAVVVYGHIHRSFIRSVRGMTVANAGSVSLSFDGDSRAAYLLLDGSVPSIRRVEYDLDQELKDLAQSGLPHTAWVERSLRSASLQMP